MPSIQAIETALRARLRQPLPGANAQRRFSPQPADDAWAPHLTPPTARRAAALILICPGPSGPFVPLTVRHASLARHAGQVSLPGGAIDRDETVDAAALRETFEEIGVPDAHIRVLGALSTLWVHASNFIVTPVIGVTDVAPIFRPHPGEVADVLEVPLAELRDPARLKWSFRRREGHMMHAPYFDVGGHVVWGATAAMLGEFVCLFHEAHAPPAPG